MKQPVSVELFYDGAWQLAPAYVRDGISLTVGRAGADSGLQPSSCNLTLDNRSEAYHPRNANSALYGKIGRNTPLRVKVGADVRHIGEVAEWKPDRSIRFLPGLVPAGDAWVLLTSAGITSRLGQGATPLKSAPQRFATDPANPPLAYWPLDEGSLATFGTPLVGRHPFRLRRDSLTSIKPGEGTLAPWLDAGVTIGGDATLTPFIEGITGDPFPYDNWAGECCFSEASGVWSLSVYDGDGLQIWRARFDAAAGEVSLRYKSAGDGGSESVLTTALTGAATDKAFHHLRLEAVRTTPGNIDLDVWVDGVNVIVNFSQATTLTGVARLRLQGDIVATSSVTFGHAAVWGGGITVGTPFNVPAIFDTSSAAAGYASERAGRRIERLCRENGLTFANGGFLFTGTLDDTAPLGAQYADKLLETLAAAAAADLGILYDRVDGVGLHYRTRTSMQNLAPALTLNFAAGEVAPPLEPAVDDLGVTNDVTVKRRDGGTSRAVLKTGRMSTQAPPAGIGTYDVEITVSAPGDGDFLDNQTGWRLHMGTVDEDRFPRISVDLDAHPELAASASALRPGDRIAVTNLPDHLSVDDLSLIIEGWTEVLGSHRRVITFNCSPESPLRIARYVAAAASGEGKRYDTDTTLPPADHSQVAATVAAGVTSIPVSSRRGPPWTEDGAEFTFDVAAAGEQLRVSSIGPGALDAFGRTVANGWGNADVGGAWTTSGGSASDYSVGSGFGVHVCSVVNSGRRTTLPGYPDVDMLCDFATDALATGASLFGALTARTLDTNTLYMARVEFTTAAGIILALLKRVASVQTSLGSFTTALTHVAGTFYRMRFRVIGSTLQARMWAVSAAEPNAWDVIATDTDLTAAETLGMRSFANTGNTNVNPQIRHDNFRLANPQLFTVARSINGVVKSQPIGTPVKLWTPPVYQL